MKTIKYIGFIAFILISTWGSFWLAIFWTRYEMGTSPGVDPLLVFMFFLMAFILMLVISFAVVSFIFFKFILKEEIW